MTTEAIQTTLAKIREHEPCKFGWVKLHKSLGGIKSYGLHTPVKFSQIAESNGLADAVWCLRSICPEHEKEVRLFAADCAESVLHLYEKEHDDTRPRDAIQAARDFANGLIDDGRRAAAWAAGDAAGDAACSAAARIAARVAARAAARDFDGVSAWDAAGDAARAAVRAAGDAGDAGDAACAAGAAVSYSRDARDAGDAARAAARAAARDVRDAQVKMLIKRFG